MKQLILTAALALCSIAGFAQVDMAAMKPLAIGATIPSGEVKMKATDGKSYSLNQLKTSKGLLVMFSCNTCPYVVKSQQRTREMMQLAKEQGLGLAIVNSNDAQRAKEDSYDAMKKYAKAQNYYMPYLLDEQSNMANAFGATRTPEVFLFDANARLVYTGAMEDNPSDPGNSKDLFLANALKHVNTDLAIEPATTKSIGCSIKRVSR